MKKTLLIVLSTFLVLSSFVSCEKKESTTTEPVTEFSTEKQIESNTVEPSEETTEADTSLEISTNAELDDAYEYLYGTYFRINNYSQPLSDTFTITLNSDGTYHYYETMISSHMGLGKYTVCGNIITLTDDNIPTLSGSKTYTFKFEYRDGKLVFLASESDRFMYVNLPDGAEFDRAPTQE